MIVSLIVAASTNNVIGKDNQLLWHLPNDLKWFKAKTWGLPVVMGRKTFESIDSKPLKGRTNFVVSRNADFAVPTGVFLTNDLPSAIVQAAEQTAAKEVMVVGGGAIYAEAMSMANRIYLTRVHTQIDGDAFFPAVDTAIWQKAFHQHFSADEKHAFDYTFEIWERITT
jgi:dihydrofolate reductase